MRARAKPDVDRDFDVMWQEGIKTKVLHFTGPKYLVSLMLQGPLKG